MQLYFYVAFCQVKDIGYFFYVFFFFIEQSDQCLLIGLELGECLLQFLNLHFVFGIQLLIYFFI